MTDRSPVGNATRIGLVGLGIMGVPIAMRLIERGHELTVWNLEPERFEAVKQAGAQWAGSPAEVWANCDVVLVCVLGDHAIESVCFGDNGFATAEDGANLLIDLSTTSPSTTRSLAARLKAECNADWLDAPMSGGPGAALDGSLAIMVGGPADLFQFAKPLLECLAGNLTHVGELASGQIAKILNQAVVGVNFILMAELLTAAKTAGLDPDILPLCFSGGMADSTILQRVYPQMSRSDFEPPRCYARQVNKDLVSVASFVDELNLKLPVIAESVARYRLWAEDGNDMEDGAAVSRLYGH